MGDCGICLKKLFEADTNYPLICPESCGFNMCQKCISHLVKTSVGDGRGKDSVSSITKVNMRLQCPWCKGDITPTIRCTLLLRKAHEIQTLRGVPDSELNGAELRQKHSISAEEIQDAKLRLDKYVADIADGNEPKDLIKTVASESNNSLMDPTFFSGLHSAVSDAEKVFITELMISGNINKLAQAAQILSEIGRAVNKGQLVASNKNKHSSILMENTSDAEKRALAMAMTKEERLKNDRLERHRRMYPLPDRMPRTVILKADFNVYAKHRKVLKFVDDGWDGSVADAFSRVSMSESTWSEDDSYELDSDDEGEVSDFVNKNIQKYKNRVLIKGARRQAAEAGILKGDVVSHVNNDEFKGTADDLKELINKFYLSGNKEYTFSLTLNAEQSTAAALKLRAMVNDVSNNSSTNFV